MLLSSCGLCRVWAWLRVKGCGALGALILAGAVHAPAWGAACPGIGLLGDPTKPVREEQLTGLQEQVNQAPLACLDDPDFLALKGRLLSLGPDPRQGLAHLEKAVLLAPHRPDLLLEFAVVAQAAREYSLAYSLVQQVLTQPGLPPGLSVSLENWLLALESQKGLRLAAGQTRLRLSAGYDTNLNNGIGISSLRLSLPGGDIDLLLGEQDKPVSGGFTYLHLQRQLAWDFDSQPWLRAGLLVAARQPFAGSRLSAQNIELWGTTLPALLQANNIADLLADPAELGFRVGVSLFGERVLAYHQALSVFWPLPVRSQPSCRSFSQIDLEHRSFPDRSAFNGLLLLGGGSMGCRSGQWGVHGQLQFGLDHALGDRPGGDAWRALGHLGVDGRVSAYTLAARLGFQFSKDQKGYSELLANSAQRRTRGWHGHLGLERVVAAGLTATARLEAFDQGSNLPLFALNGRRIYLGLEWEQ